MKRIATIAAFVGLVGIALSAQTPQAPAKAATPPVVLAQAPPAQPILDAALTRAAAEHKSVFVHFSASWCGWCHKLEKFLATPDGQSLSPYMVDVILVVQESGDKKPLENPGAADIMKSWGGTGGIPFYAFLDGKGAVLSNSNALEGGANIGYPANDKEWAAFETVLTKGLPNLPADVRTKVMTYLRANP